MSSTAPSSRSQTLKSPKSAVEHLKIQDVLSKLKHSANISQDSLFSTLSSKEADFLNAAATGDITSLQECLKSGADINCKDEWGRNALMFAAAENNLLVGSFLIQHGIDLNAKNLFEETAYNVAAISGSRDFCDLLVKNGVVPDTTISNNSEDTKSNPTKSGFNSFMGSSFFSSDIPPPTSPVIPLSIPSSSASVSSSRLIPNLCIEVLEGEHLDAFLPEQRFSNLVHVRIEVANEQFSTNNINISAKDSVEWNESFSCYVDFLLKPSIKVLLCDEDDFDYGEFNVGFGWYGETDSMTEWFDLKEPTRSVMNLTLKNQSSNNTSPVPSSRPKPRLRLQISLAKNAVSSQAPLLTVAPQQMIGVLSEYQSLHQDPLPLSVSQTVVGCFKALLAHDILLENVRDHIKKYLELANHTVATDLMRDAYVRYQFSPEHQSKVIKQIIAMTSPSKKSLSVIIQEFVKDIMTSWELNPVNIQEFITNAFSKKFEEGFLASLGLSGAGKYILPIWPKLVLAVGVTTYFILKDTYLRYTEAYFSSKQKSFNKLANPDYYGRFAGCVFDTLVKFKLGMINKQVQESFLGYLFKFDSTGNLHKSTKLEERFVQEWKKSSKPFSEEKYISTRNMLLPNVSSMSLLAQTIMTPEQKSPRLLDSQDTSIHSVAVNSVKAVKLVSESVKSTLEKRHPSLLTHERRRPSINPILEESSEMLLPVIKPNETNTKLEEVNRSRPTEMTPRQLMPTHSQRALLLSNLAENPDRSKILPGLFFLDRDVQFCISIHAQFHMDRHVRVLNTSIVDLKEDKYDVLIVPGNAFCIPEKSNIPGPIDDMLQALGTPVFDAVKRRIQEDYFGELPLGTSIIVETPSNVKLCQYVIYTCAYIFDKPTDPYTTLWSALRSVAAHNRKQSEKRTSTNFIRSIVCCAHGLLAPHMRSFECVFQMALAYNQFMISVLHKPIEVTSLSEIKKEREVPELTPEERQKHRKSTFEAMVLSGAIQRRKFIDEEGVQRLIYLVLGITEEPKADSSSLKRSLTPKKNDKHIEACLHESHTLTKDLFSKLRQGESEQLELQKAAAAALISYTFPVELYNGIRKRLEQSHVLDALIEFAASGRIRAYHQIERSEIELGEEIARGASGKVFKGFYKEHIVAIKHCSPHYQGYDPIDVTREIAVMSLLRHKNILLCFGAVVMEPDTLIVSEYIDGGTLSNWLRAHISDVPIVAALTISVQLARALRYIHSLHLLHCDLKGKNILISRSETSEDIVAKIIDFGSSRTEFYDPELHVPVGTPAYMAPEVTLRQGYTTKSDIFSLGMVYFEILTQTFPFNDEANGMAITLLVEKGKRPPILKRQIEWCPAYAKLVERCWHQKPEKRPTTSEVIDLLSQIAESVHFSFKKD